MLVLKTAEAFSSLYCFLFNGEISLGYLFSFFFSLKWLNKDSCELIFVFSPLSQCATLLGGHGVVLYKETKGPTRTNKNPDQQGIQLVTNLIDHVDFS